MAYLFILQYFYKKKNNLQNMFIIMGNGNTKWQVETINGIHWCT